MIYPNLQKNITELDIHAITDERKQMLNILIDFIQEKASENQTITLNFICTHNSRRSHLGQIWAQTMAHFYGIKNVSCYSGGTEATALFPMVAKTLTNLGFEICTLSTETNPVYAIKFDENEMPNICFSKKFDEKFNPSSKFAAIMTCSQADEGCPFIAGAEKRIPITYHDPKAFDNTPLQEEKYKERAIEIGTEMKYVFSKIKI
jgi:arsenate reductase (thioredoxin)